MEKSSDHGQTPARKCPGFAKTLVAEATEFCLNGDGVLGHKPSTPLHKLYPACAGFLL